MTQPNGPRARPTTGRNRNTMRNHAAGGGTGGNPAGVFPLGVSDTTEFGIAKGALWDQYQLTRKNLRAQRQMVKSQYRHELGDIRADARGASSELQGSMAERGLIGSAVNLAETEGLRGEAQGMRADAALSKQTTMMGLGQQGLEANMQLRQGLVELMLRKAAAQREMALSAFGSAGANPWGYQTSTS